jgi:hypothetical protein
VTLAEETDMGASGMFYDAAVWVTTGRCDAGSARNEGSSVDGRISRYFAGNVQYN